MKLDADKFTVISSEILNEISIKLIQANLDDRLEEYLLQIGCESYIKEEEKVYEGYAKGKILLMGDIQIKDRDLRGLFKSLGFNFNNRVEKVGFDESKRYNVTHLQYNNNYRLIIAGPMPHSTVEKDDYSSVIQRMIEEDGFPKVVKGWSNNELKLTKSNLREILEIELAEGFIEI